MSRDILFKTEEFVFSYRVGGLLTHNNKILLQKPKNDHYASGLGNSLSPNFRSFFMFFFFCFPPYPGKHFC